jgi:hypothetical protein
MIFTSTMAAREARRAGLVCLINRKAAEQAQQLFINNNLRNNVAHALVAVPLPLPTHEGELMATLVRFIPAASISASIARSAASGFVSGVGVNPIFWKWLLVNVVDLNKTAENYEQTHGEGMALLTIVELANHIHGYPNCDIVGCLGFGMQVPQDDDVPAAARRLAQRESKVIITPEHFGPVSTASFSSTFVCQSRGGGGAAGNWRQAAATWVEHTVTCDLHLVAANNILRCRFDGRRLIFEAAVPEPAMEAAVQPGAEDVGQGEPGPAMDDDEEVQVAIPGQADAPPGSADGEEGELAAEMANLAVDGGEAG